MISCLCAVCFHRKKGNTIPSCPNYTARIGDPPSALTLFIPSSFFTSSPSSLFRFRLFSSITSFQSLTSSFARSLTPGAEWVLSFPTATPALDD